MAVSSSKRNGGMRAQLRIDFQGRGTVEAFPRARVQPMRLELKPAPFAARASLPHAAQPPSQQVEQGVP